MDDSEVTDSKKSVQTLGSFTDGRDNNLNLTRFVLAVLVIYSHSFPLVFGKEVSDPVRGWFGFSVGDFAVNGFFVISGFLITRSWIRTTFKRNFVLARVARIYPALIVAVLFCVAIGFFQTSLSTSEYFGEKLTRNYIAKSILLIPGKMQFALPGVFESLPYPCIVNGSLWTLPYEILLYITIGVLGIAGALKQKQIGVLLCCASIIFYAFFATHDNHAARFAAFGACGALFYFLQSHVHVSFSWVAVATAAMVISVLLGQPKFTQLIVCSYGVLWVGFIPAGPIRSFNSVGDYSYGVYIFAYPIQQTLVNNFAPNLTPVTLFIAATFLTLIPAVLSWHLLESKALQLSKRWRVAA